MDRKDVIKIIIVDTLILGAIAGVPYEVARESNPTRPVTLPYEFTEAGFREMGRRACEASLNQSLGARGSTG
jgi:hypothetical protein